MRLPNGYGSITKLSGKRRKPYLARISIKQNGVVIGREVLGYYATKSDALEALAEYNKSPFNLIENNLTFKEAYDFWRKKNYPNLSESAKQSREAAFSKIPELYDMKIRHITTAMLQEMIDRCLLSSASQNNIKTVISSAYEYAISCNVVSNNLSRNLKIRYTEAMIDHHPFSDEELKMLWDKSDRWDVQILLILIYSGMRVNEFLKNKKENVNLEERWIYIPSAKNKSSIRYVPIHEKVLTFWENFYNRATDYLVTNPNGTVITYNNFVSRNFSRINKECGFSHNFHDTRHTFATLAHRFELDELTTQKILGHTPETITKKVYTHITLEDMHRELRKITI